MNTGNQTSTGVRTLRVAIESTLKNQYASEIYWAWRLILSSMGFGWVECAADDKELDIYYGASSATVKSARLHILADVEAWKNVKNYRLEGLIQQNDWLYPIFKNEDRNPLDIFTKNNSVTLTRDLIFAVFWFATGQEEKFWRQNNHGHYLLDPGAYTRDQMMTSATLSSLIQNLQILLADIGYTEGVPRWPNGKIAAAAASHDVDYPEVYRWLEPLRILRKQKASGIRPAFSVFSGKRSHWNFAAWMSMEKKLDTKSAFYFVPRQGSLVEYARGKPDPFYDIEKQHFRDLFSKLTDQGFEIGLHSSYCAYQSEAGFYQEKHKLEQVTGATIHGNRHHYWHMDPNKHEDTLLIHEKINLDYDASVFHEYYLGWRRGLCVPYFPFHQGEKREITTLQLPTAWMDAQLFSYRKYNPGDPLKRLHDLANTVVQVGGCLLVDIREYAFDDVLYPGWAKTYKELWKFLIERGDIWFTTPAEMTLHWRARVAAIKSVSQGL